MLCVAGIYLIGLYLLISPTTHLRTTGWRVVLGGFSYIASIFLWHFEIFPLTILAMLVLLASLIVFYLCLGIGRAAVSKAMTWLVRVPFSIYLG